MSEADSLGRNLVFMRPIVSVRQDISMAQFGGRLRACWTNRSAVTVSPSALRQAQDKLRSGQTPRKVSFCRITRFFAALLRNCGNPAPAVIANPALGGVKQSHVVGCRKTIGSRWSHDMRLLRPSPRLRRAEGLAMTRSAAPVSSSNFGAPGATKDSRTFAGGLRVSSSNCAPPAGQGLRMTDSLRRGFVQQALENTH